jgi:putative transposase
MLSASLWHARFVWNWALAEWNDRYELGANPDACEIKRYFNSFKYEAFPWLKNIDWDAHAQAFAALGKAWKAYFKGEVEGRPRFKKKGKCRDSFYVACDQFCSRGKTVRLPVIGQVKLREPLRFTGKMQSATVSREADRWFIAMAVEIAAREVQPPSGEAVGIDLGLTTFAVLSNGPKVEAPKPLGKGLHRLRRLSRAHFPQAARFAQSPESRFASRALSSAHGQYTQRFPSQVHDQDQQKPRGDLCRGLEREGNDAEPPSVPGHPRCGLVGDAAATGV